MTRDRSRVPVEIWIVDGERGDLLPDELAAEAPLQIGLGLVGEGGTWEVRSLAVTLRTPGHDRELALGFLHNEGLIETATDVTGWGGDNSGDADVVVAHLRPGLAPDLEPLARHGFTTSACGLCGKAEIDALFTGSLPTLPAGPVVSPAVLHGLPDALRRAQATFRATGGLHAAALFDAAGTLLAAFEDVGRHNAFDKLSGWALAEGLLPLHDHLVLVSGRVSYELVQKCARIEAPVLAAVSAPSSLAVATARRFGLTLVGFLRDGRFNVYGGPERVAGLRDD